MGLAMTITELLKKILSNYETEFVKNPKTSNSFFVNLKKTILETFSKISYEYELMIDPLGGAGMMPKKPYIAIMDYYHKTSMGFYVTVEFNSKNESIYLGFNHSYKNPPNDQFIEVLQNYTKKRLIDLSINDYGYPQKEIKIQDLTDEIFINELKYFLDIYVDSLYDFESEFEEFIGDENNFLERFKKFTFTEEHIRILFDDFELWYQMDDHKDHENIESYSNFSEEYFRGLSDDEFIDVFFNFAREGGKNPKWWSSDSWKA
jgi:hypothetical protein